MGHVEDVVKAPEDYDTLHITADECFNKDTAGVYTDWKAYRTDYDDEEEGLIAVENKIKEATKAIKIKDEKESDYIGNVGDKIVVAVTLKRQTSFEFKPAYSYYTDTMNIYTFVDENDNVLVWKTTSFMYYEDGDNRYYYKEGDNLKIKATIKALDVYNGVKQTVLTRVKIVG